MDAVKEWASPPRANDGFQLVIDTGEERKMYELGDKAIHLLGRKETDVDIYCPEKMCSRVHACIAHRKGRFFLVDLGSVAGVQGDRDTWGEEAEEYEGQHGGRQRRKEERHPDRHIDSRSRGRQYDESRYSSAEVRDSKHRLRGESYRQRDDAYRTDKFKRHGHDSRQSRDLTGNHQRGSSGRDRHERHYHKRKSSPPSRDRSPNMPDRRDRRRDASPYPRRDEGISGSSGPPRHTFMPVQQKKALLWGGKASTGQPVDTQFGANRWDTAQFENETDRLKFQKLMGVKAAAPAGPHAGGSPETGEEHGGVLHGDAQTRVLTEVETHFMQGLRRADGRKVGLGL